MENDIQQLNELQENYRKQHKETKKVETILPGEVSQPIGLAPTIIQDYIEMMKDCTDAPEEFLVASFLSLTSTLCGTSYTLEDGSYLNTYIILVGKSAITRKTTVQKHAFRMLREVVGWLGEVTGEVSVKSKKKSEQNFRTVKAFDIISHGSVEGMRSCLDGDGKSILYGLSEYKTVFDISKRSGAGNTITELTALYDSLPINEALRGSKTTPSGDNAFSILGCSTPHWLNDLFTKSNAAGGFINRHLCIYGFPSPTPLLEPIKPDAQKWKNIVYRLVELFPKRRFLQIEDNHKFECDETILKISSDAKSFLNFVITDHHVQILNNEDDEYGELVGREITNAKKIAGLSAVLKGSTEIDLDSIKFGYFMANSSSKVILQMASNQPTSKKDKLLSFISRRGPVQKREIAQYFGGSQSIVNQMLAELEEEGEVVKNDGKWTNLRALNV